MTATDSAELLGVCPHCSSVDDYLNIGKGHWGYCLRHSTRWFIGSNKFSSWRYETEEEQRRKYAELHFDEFETVEGSG